MTQAQSKQGAAGTLVAPVWNKNHTKAFEETITNIHTNTGGQRVGTVENSFGRNGRTVAVFFNSAHQVWDYV